MSKFLGVHFRRGYWRLISVVYISVDSESEFESDEDDSSLLDELSLELEALIDSNLDGFRGFRM